MPSPFPGMDPYLEGYLWPDVHHALASKIRQQLTQQKRTQFYNAYIDKVVDDLRRNEQIEINQSLVDQIVG